MGSAEFITISVPGGKTATIAFILAIILTIVSAFNWQNCGNLEKTFRSAENRALKTDRTLREETVSSAVRCVSYCHANMECQSVNYHKTSHVCQMNNLTRKHDSASFIINYGSVYFDADEETTSFSVPQPSDCNKLHAAGHNEGGIYTIFPAGFNDAGLRVYCDMETDDDGWIVFQRRQDGSVDFDRNWADYQAGFGNLAGEFWLGNDNLRTLTESGGPWKLRVDFVFLDTSVEAWAEYEGFKILGKKYQLQFDSYNPSSTAADSLTHHIRMKFTTKDNDNDNYGYANCAITWEGGWWYYGFCGIQCNFNSKYGTQMYWERKLVSKSEMKIRST